MNHKVLLADDSLTIQKVIKITLAHQPYEITDCSTEDELFRNLPNIQPKLVFLDFNLSDKYTGYELTTKIKSLSPSTKVLLLLGTFDTVDEAAMEKCGASDKIVKPFDSNKFIAVCKQLIDTFVDDSELPYPQTQKPASPFIAPNSDDQWKVNHSSELKVPVQESKPLDNSFPDTMNTLEKEVSDWSMSVPGVINDNIPHDKLIDLPPVIGTPRKLASVEKGDVRFPVNEDLDYPTIEEMNENPKTEVHQERKPKYIDATNLIAVNFDQDSTGEFQIETNFPVDETDVSKIEAQIQDEVSENLWQADEFEDLKKEVSAKIEEVKNNFQTQNADFNESIFGGFDDKDSIKWNESSDAFKVNVVSNSSEQMKDMRGEMEAMVKKYVQEYMDQMFQKNVEKVSWEVIPDLAENLIRQELSKISHKILNDQN